MLKHYFAASLLLATTVLVPTHTAIPAIEHVVVAAVLAQAAPVKTVVKPTALTVKPGELVKLDFGLDDGEVVTWWLPGGDRRLYDIANDGSTCFFATASPGVYYFARIASRSADDKITQSITEHVVTVQGTAPLPVDPARPPPPVVVVDPVKPSGKTFGLTPFVTNLIKANAAALDMKMCPEFSGNWGAVATQIEQRQLTTWPEVSAKMKELNSATAAKTVPGWGRDAIVSAGINKEIARLISSKAFNNEDMSETMKVFQEVRDGYAGAAR